MSSTPKYFVPGNSTAALMLNRSGDIGRIIGEYEGGYYLVKFPGSSEDEQWHRDDGYTADTKAGAEKISSFYLHYQNEE